MFLGELRPQLESDFVIKCCFDFLLFVDLVSKRFNLLRAYSFVLYVLGPQVAAEVDFLTV